MHSTIEINKKFVVAIEKYNWIGSMQNLQIESGDYVSDICYLAQISKYLKNYVSLLLHG